jgi:hypothetical protein
MVSGRCYLGKIPMQADNPWTTLSAYVPVSEDTIVDTNMAGRARLESMYMFFK